MTTLQKGDVITISRRPGIEEHLVVIKETKDFFITRNVAFNCEIEDDDILLPKRSLEKDLTHLQARPASMNKILKNYLELN